MQYKHTKLRQRELTFNIFIHGVDAKSVQLSAESYKIVKESMGKISSTLLLQLSINLRLNS